jgi:hypothetical protein
MRFGIGSRKRKQTVKLLIRAAGSSTRDVPTSASLLTLCNRYATGGELAWDEASVWDLTSQSAWTLL